METRCEYDGQIERLGPIGAISDGGWGPAGGRRSMAHVTPVGDALDAVQGSLISTRH